MLLVCVAVYALIRLIGYGPKIPGLLGERFEVWQPSDNGRYSAFTLHSIMHYWQDGIAGADLIHWNNGLWDSAIVCKEDGMFTTVEVGIG